MTIRRVGLVALALGHLTCHQVILTAPPGSTMELFANPEFIAAHGDVSVITAFVMEANGTPVADGTVVQFFTNLGKIQEQAKTNDGVARVNLISDSRSGDATVSAFSGGGSGGGGTPTTTSTTLTTAPVNTPSGRHEVSTMGNSGGTRLGAVSATNTVVVHIGSARPALVVVTANPSRITSSRSTQIVANVFDADGNPIANVPVIFSVSAAGRSSTETMDSGGAPIFTDTNGQASDVMRTRYPRDAAPVTATVTATVPNGIDGEVTVVIN
jgi:hypothetical protein